VRSMSRTTLAIAVLIAFSTKMAITADVPARTGEESRPGGTVREIPTGTFTPAGLTLLMDGTRLAQAESDAAKPFPVRVTLDARQVLHAINPLIYGASGVEPARAKDLGLSAVRWGGNRSSRYNWKTEADNAGSDWFFLNGKAGRWSDFVSNNRRAGLTSYLTVPMLPWVAKGPEGWSFSVAKYGPQQKVEQYLADRGAGTRPDGTPITGNDPRDSSVPATPEFQATGIRTLPRDPKRPIVYGLDNEPMLWHATHRDVFPKGLSYDECLERGVALATAIKGADPSGLVAGPCTWGWTDLMYSAADAGGDNYATHADRKAHGDKPFLAWYLGAMKSASARAGKRLLDYVDVHFYPQGQVDGHAVNEGKSPHSRAMRSLRLRSTRGLWGPSYRDESWIREPVALIPRVRAWVAQENPGTKLVIGEYSWGGDDDASGAIAQAEILGIFGRENVDAAFYWAGLEGVQRFAFQLYRNPDSQGHGFGDRALPCKSNTADRLAAYAALRDDGALTLVLVNKDLDRPAEVQLDVVDHKVRKPGGMIYRLPNPPGPIRKETLSGDVKRIMVPPLSAALIVRP
jgi:Glycoside hydrolase family 44